MSLETLRLSELVDQCVNRYRASWQDLESEFRPIGEPFSAVEKRDNRRLAIQLLTDMDRHLRAFPRSVERQADWRASAFTLLRRFVERCLRYTEAEQALLFDQQYQQVTNDFVEQAQTFDPSIDMDDLFQALRNVWIMNSIQALLDRRISLTPSVFAYSMLYPSTDNVLDDPTRSDQEKQEFNNWVERRIQGEPCAPNKPQLSLLFELIETEHRPSSAPQVLDSVMAIQRAQRAAMVQQSSRVDDDRLLALSIAKGGTSVLAHGYLVNQDVSVEQADFLFGFGVFLQLLDDLQDLNSDLEVGHCTLFSRAVMQGGLIDPSVCKLLNLMRDVLVRIGHFPSRDSQLLREVIWRNCVLLLISSIAHHEAHCSRQLIEQLEPYSPFHFSTIRELNRTLHKRYRRIRQELVGGERVRTVWNVLGPASPDLWKLPRM